MWGTRKGEWGVLTPNEEKIGMSKMSGLDRDEPLWNGQSSLYVGMFKVGGKVCQGGTEGCWENLAKSAMRCKVCTSVPCM